MKKVFIILIIIFLTIVYINVSNNDKNLTNTEQEETSYYTSIKPVEMEYNLYEGKLIESRMLLVKETTEFENEEFMELKEHFDFEKNTYIILNCEDEIKSIKAINLKKDDVHLKVLCTVNGETNYAIIEIKNLVIKNLNLINIE